MSGLPAPSFVYVSLVFLGGGGGARVYVCEILLSVDLPNHAYLPTHPPCGFCACPARWESPWCCWVSTPHWPLHLVTGVGFCRPGWFPQPLYQCTTWHLSKSISFLAFLWLFLLVTIVSRKKTSKRFVFSCVLSSLLFPPPSLQSQNPLGHPENLKYQGQGGMNYCFSKERISVILKGK